MKSGKVLYFLFVFVSSVPYNIVAAVKMGEFYRFANQQMPNIISQHSTGSAVKCCVACNAHKDCQSVNYNHVTRHCQLVPYLLLSASPLYTSNSSWSVYSKRDWLPVFVGLAGNGVDVYDSYIDGTSAVTDDVNCMTLNMAACQQNYRSPVMDSWSSITQVKYSLYKSGQEVAYAIFNGTGSSFTDWFSRERLMTSSWTEALTTTSFNFFSIAGDTTRRFSMNLNYGGCSVDKYFTVAVTNGSSHSCIYDQASTFPQFIYSNATSPTCFETGLNTEYAEYMAIFIQ